MYNLQSLSPTVLRNFIAKKFHVATRQVVYLPMQIVYLPMFHPAISYVHKILNLQDPAEVFLVKKVIQGGHHFAPCKDSRLPVTGRILANIMRDISTSIQHLYKKGSSCHFSVKLQCLPTLGRDCGKNKN